MKANFEHLNQSSVFRIGQKAKAVKVGLEDFKARYKAWCERRGIPHGRRKLGRMLPKEQTKQLTGV